MRGKELLSRKKLALFLGPVLLLSAAGMCQTQELNVRVISRRANVLEKPRLKSDVVGSVKRWMLLQVDEKEGEWYKICLPLKLEGYALSGYIHQSLVEEVGKEVPASRAKFQEKKTSVSDHKYGAGLGLGSVFLYEKGYGDGLRLSGNFYYKIAERLSLELSIQTYRVNVKEDALELSVGKLLMVPIQLSLQGHFPLKNNFILYLICGLGYYLNNYSSRAITIPEMDEKVNNSLGIHFGGGVDYFFHKNIALSADLCFCRVEPNVSITYLGERWLMGDVNLSSFILGIGVKYFF
jgi:outer membrane protein W